MGRTIVAVGVTAMLPLMAKFCSRLVDDKEKEAVAAVAPAPQAHHEDPEMGTSFLAQATDVCASVSPSVLFSSGTSSSPGAVLPLGTTTFSPAAVGAPLSASGVLEICLVFFALVFLFPAILASLPLTLTAGPTRRLWSSVSRSARDASEAIDAVIASWMRPAFAGRVNRAYQWVNLVFDGFDSWGLDFKTGPASLVDHPGTRWALIVVVACFLGAEEAGGSGPAGPASKAQGGNGGGSGGGNGSGSSGSSGSSGNNGSNGSNDQDDDHNHDVSSLAPELDDDRDRDHDVPPPAAPAAPAPPVASALPAFGFAFITGSDFVPVLASAPTTASSPALGFSLALGPCSPPSSPSAPTNELKELEIPALTSATSPEPASSPSNPPPITGAELETTEQPFPSPVAVPASAHDSPPTTTTTAAAPEPIATAPTAESVVREEARGGDDYKDDEEQTTGNGPGEGRVAKNRKRAAARDRLRRHAQENAHESARMQHGDATGRTEKTINQKRNAGRQQLGCLLAGDAMVQWHAGAGVMPEHLRWDDRGVTGAFALNFWPEDYFSPEAVEEKAEGDSCDCDWCG